MDNVIGFIATKIPKVPQRIRHLTDVAGFSTLSLHPKSGAVQAACFRVWKQMASVLKTTVSKMAAAVTEIGCDGIGTVSVSLFRKPCSSAAPSKGFWNKPPSVTFLISSGSCRAAFCRYFFAGLAVA